MKKKNRTKPKLKTTKSVKPAKPSKPLKNSSESPVRSKANDFVPFEYNGSFPIVAVGASAGGVESFSELLSDLTPNTGMGYVLIQHLAPHHESLLPAILSRVSQMPVYKAESEMPVRPNCVYVIPPNTNMGLINGVIKLLPRLDSPNRHMPVDFFFRCLADDQAHLAIGVVLSGADGDGAQGLRAIRSQGGLAIVQDPKTAKVDGMPRHAIQAGATDNILPIAGIARELIRLGAHPLSRNPSAMATETDLNKVFTILKMQTGVDFSKYKPGTVMRRLRRRILLHKAETISEYLKVLGSNREEVADLYDDLLINVTSFFRDAAVFECLEKTLLKALERDESSDQVPFRVWVPACSSGEEAFSLAICILEIMERKQIRRSVQIFASDLSETALEKAREGSFSDGIHGDMSAERLRRFFTKTPGGYRVVTTVREICIFAKHDVTRDPPFSKMDLISCRNLLIYLDLSTQKRVLNLFAYALNPDGILVLGSSETTSSSENFETIDSETRIYRRKAVITRGQLEIPLLTSANKIQPMRPSSKYNEAAMEIDREVTRLLIERFAPAGVVVDESMHILQFRGATGKFLEPSSGEASLSLFKMIREGLDTELRILVKQAEKSGKLTRKENIEVRGAPSPGKVTLEVLPIHVQSERKYYLILFDERTQKGAAQDVSDSATATPISSDVQIFKDELVATRQHLQSIIREQDTSNEELQAANEEVLSSNEELQSTNEELETAKEELQSTNEELSTVNDELSNRNSSLIEANNDLNNLLASVNLPIVMIGNDLRIRRFTPMVEKVLNVIASDIGRPITDIKPNIEVPDLEEMILKTLNSGLTVEREVQDRSLHWFSLRIRPYRSAENKIDGAVLIVVDLGSKEMNVNQTADPHSDVQEFVNQMEEPILFLDRQFQVQSVNRAYLRAFQVSLQDVLHTYFFELENGAWNQALLKALMVDVIPQGNSIRDFCVKHTFPNVGKKSLLLNARRITREDTPMILVLLDQVQSSSQDKSN